MGRLLMQDPAAFVLHHDIVQGDVAGVSARLHERDEIQVGLVQLDDRAG